MLILILAYFALSARSCESTDSGISQEDQFLVSEQFETLETIADLDVLKDEEHFIFERKAIQKIRDLEDYLSVYTSDTLDDTFRKNARTLIEGLFLSQSQNWSISIGVNSPIMQLSSVLDYLSPSMEERIQISFDSIQIIQNLKRNASNQYDGKVLLNQRTELVDGNTRISSMTEQKMVNIHVKKIKLEIGKEIKQSWRLFIGDIQEFTVINLPPK